MGGYNTINNCFFTIICWLCLIASFLMWSSYIVLQALPKKFISRVFIICCSFLFITHVTDLHVTIPSSSVVCIDVLVCLVMWLLQRTEFSCLTILLPCTVFWRISVLLYSFFWCKMQTPRYLNTSFFLQFCAQCPVCSSPANSEILCTTFFFEKKN